MIIDFKEIPQANRGGGDQDTFELFSRDFIGLLGYEIVSDPARGADGGIDFKVKEVRESKDGTVTLYWLASCKHYAHSGVAISTEIESNIYDRVISNACQGFIGIYSTIPTNGLVNTLNGLSENGKIETKIYDHEKIESQIVGISSLEQLFIRFFPISYKKWVETYYFKEPISLFENYYNNKFIDGFGKVFLTPFHSIGNLIKTIRKYNKIEDALKEQGIKLILDSGFDSYNHRRDKKFIADTKSLQINPISGIEFNYVTKYDKDILNAYLLGLAHKDRRPSLVKLDKNFIYEKIKYRYDIILPPNSYLYFIYNAELNSSLHLFTTLMIVGDGHYTYLNDLFTDLKSMLE